MTPKTAAALRALVSEISKTAFHQHEQGMREMPDLLESYANRLAAVLISDSENTENSKSGMTQEGADTKCWNCNGTGEVGGTLISVCFYCE